MGTEHTSAKRQFYCFSIQKSMQYRGVAGFNTQKRNGSAKFVVTWAPSVICEEEEEEE